MADPSLDFRACVLVPCLDCARTIAPIVRQAKAQVQTVLVIDDGSTDGTADVAAEAGAEVMRHPHNRGKGAALLSGLYAARERGFSHVVTIDGDGQHDAAAIPSLIAVARSQPGALVVGAREFPEENVPRSSRFGRWWSNLWVYLDTGRRLSDTQSGMRVYPVEQTLALCVRPSRFEWEVEAIVRTCWAGAPVVDTPVGVRYPPERKSHYRGFYDSMRISRLHCRLFFSSGAVRAWLRRKDLPKDKVANSGRRGARMARREEGAYPSVRNRRATTPAGMHRRPETPSYPEAGPKDPIESRLRWTGRSRGTSVGYQIFQQAMRLFGRRAGYLMLWFVVPYYVLLAHTARRQSAAYLSRVLGPRTWWRRPIDVGRHFMAFGRSILDTALVMQGRSHEFVLQHEHLEYIRESYAKGRGLILLSAHVGSRAVAGELLDGLKLNLVAYDNEAEEIRRFYARLRTGDAPRVIVANDGFAASIEILGALARGEAVAMLADRTRAGRSLRVPFLGEPAAFPAGPFLVAVLSGAPVVIAFGMKDGARGQHFYALPPRTPGPVPRDRREQAIRETAEWYVAELESFVRRNPYQWYNFYDFWAREN